MEPSANSPSRTAALVAAASVVLLFAAVKVTAPILGPVMLSLLLALMIRPMIDWLARRRLRRGLTILVSIVVLLVVGFGVISVLGVSLGRLREGIPVYQDRLHVLLGNLQTQLAARGIDVSGLLTPDVMSAERIGQIAQKLLGGVSSLLSGALLILFLVILFVAEMPLLNKVLDQGKRGQWATLTTGIQKYIALTGLLGLVNAILNLVLLLLLGVDFPGLWAVVCFFFNFVPAVGNVLALTPPALLALLEFGWQRALIVVVGFFVTNMLMDMVVKPKLMKTSLDISPLVVILSLIFWGWLLGPAGPILAIPLTMVVKQLFFRSPAAKEAASVS